MTKIDRTNLKYRPCVGIALFNHFDYVFVGERIDTPGSWQMPQGGIDVGETIEDAAMREFTEELGTDKAEIIKVAEQTVKYDLPDELVSKLWNGEYRGQEQHWVAMRFTGKDNDIDINRFDPPEFQNWKWVEMEKTLDMIVPFKRDVYEHVIKMFDPNTL